MMLIAAEQRVKACDVPGVLFQVLRFLILEINYYWPGQIIEEKIKKKKILKNIKGKKAILTHRK